MRPTFGARAGSFGLKFGLGLEKMGMKWKWQQGTQSRHCLTYIGKRRSIREEDQVQGGAKLGCSGSKAWTWHACSSAGASWLWRSDAERWVGEVQGVAGSADDAGESFAGARDAAAWPGGRELLAWC